MLHRFLGILLIVFIAGAAYGQFPATGNKSRLGWQTTADGLVYRGTLADTTSIKPTGLNNAYFILDTVNAVLYRYIKTQGGWQEVGGGLEMPFDSATFVTSYEGTANEGMLIWNTQSGTLHLGMAGGIEMPIGQGEAHMVRNVTGSQIAKGKVVYISGATGQRPQISLADADAEMSSSGTFGITAEAIDNNDIGFVFTSGYIKGINTSALTEGEALWLDTVPGNFTHDKPTAPVHAVLVGYVITKKNNGEIFVKIQNGYELGELHNVNTQGQAAQDILRYNGTIWQPGKDTSLYNMDARLKGNRLVSMGNADLQFREQAGGADFVQIRPTYVSVENTSTTNNAVLTQYGLQSGSGTIPNNVLSQIYLNGEFSVYTNAATSVPGTEPDLYIDGNGKTRFRVSAPGTLDSLYGKNATGELTAMKNNLADTVLYVERKDTAAMLQPYLRKADTLSMLSTYISNADTATMLSTYISVADTATMLSTYISNADTATMLSTYISNADTSVFARDVQIAGTAGQVTYFNGANTVTSDTAFRWSATNKTLGINTPTTSGANLIIKNSQEPVRSTVVTTQTFAADTTNWTRGAGWTFNGTVAVATAATGDLTYTPALTITSGNAYEITYTVTGYTAGTLTARIGNANYSLPAHNATGNVILLTPTSATGGFRFTTSTFTGNLDNVSIVQIANPAPVLIAGQDDNGATIYEFLRLPNNTSIAAQGGGRYLTGLNHAFFGENAGSSNTIGNFNNFFGFQAGFRTTTGSSNNFFGRQAGNDNTIGSRNNFFGDNAGLRNTTGNENNFFGTGAGGNNTTGLNNNFFGQAAGDQNVSGGNNNFFGSSAGRFNTTGNNNVFIGTRAGQSNTTGGSNTYIGYQTAQLSTTGSNNIAIGLEAGYYIRSGSSNIVFGVDAGPQAAADSLGGNNNVIIGTSAADNIRGTAAGNVAIGNTIDLPTATNNNQGVYQNVLFFTGASGTGTTIAAGSRAGIKTNAPNRDFEVAGEVRITDLATDAPTRIVGADADGDLGQMTAGNGIAFPVGLSTIVVDTSVIASKTWVGASVTGDTARFIERKDTATMLLPYLLKMDTLGMLTTYINNADTATMLSTYISNADTATMFSTYISNADTALMLSTYISNADTAGMLNPYLLKKDTAAMLTTYIANSDTAAMLSTYISVADTAAMLNTYISNADTSAMLNPYLRKADTLAMLSTYISNADTALMLSTYISNADTLGMLSTYISAADTATMLSTYISNADTATMLSTYISVADTLAMLSTYISNADTATMLSTYISVADTSGMLSSYISAADTSTMLNPYLLKRDTLSMLSTYISNADTLAMLSTYISNADTATMLSTYISNADTLAMLSTYISNADTSGMLSTYISNADTATMLSTYISVADTSIMLNPYLRKADTLAMLSTYISNADTLAMLSTYISNADTSGMLSSYISAADTATMLNPYLLKRDASFNPGVTITTSGSTVNLTASSNTVQIYRGTGNYTYKLPSTATTVAGKYFEFKNESSLDVVTVITDNLNALLTLYPGQWGRVMIISTANNNNNSFLVNNSFVLPLVYEYDYSLTDGQLTIPLGCKRIEIVCIGAGGGGGGGGRGDNTALRYGGSGGGGGAYSFVTINAESIKSPLKITTGTGGTGGAGATVDNATGGNGTAGGFTRVTDSANIVLCYAGGGGGGNGGGTAFGTVGSGGNVGDFLGVSGGNGGGGPGDNSPGKAPSGGGGGGAILTSNTIGGGGAGGNYNYGTTQSNAGVIGGARNGTSGGTPSAGQVTGGGGGGGGVGNTTAVGGNGGAGVRGGGGGGGSASRNTYTSGAGGSGGAGYVRVIFY